jgi:Uma2 family endonuclease
MRSMQSDTLVSAEEYLHTSYSPDCEYVDGKTLERNLGDWEHARLQSLALKYLAIREDQWQIRAVVEQRVQVKPDRYRVPDVCVVRASAQIESIITHPPFLCIEVLSPLDRMTAVLVKVDEYLAFGVNYVWVIDPLPRHAQIYDATGVHSMIDGKLWTANPDILVPLDQLFD